MEQGPRIRTRLARRPRWIFLLPVVCYALGPAPTYATRDEGDGEKTGVTARGETGKAATPKKKEDGPREKKPAPAAERAEKTAIGTEIPKKAAKKEGAAPAAGEAEELPESQEPPKPPTFRLQDGTRISGFPRIKKISLDTAYGPLLIPVEEIIRIRFAREEDPELQDRIRQLTLQLGDEEFEVREKAMADLREIGGPARKLLREALESDDQEVVARAETLLSEIEEEAEEDLEDEDDEDSAPISGTDDEVVTLKFTARGRVAERTYRIQSNYGELLVNRKNIISIVFQEFTPAVVELNVPGTYFAPSNSWYQTKVALEKGDEVEITAGGQIHLQDYGQTSGPEGTTRVSGHHFQSFRIGALVARVGTRGKPFLVGPKVKTKADTGGKLMFAVAYRGGRVTGSFSVKVHVLPSATKKGTTTRRSTTTGAAPAVRAGFFRRVAR